MNLYEIFLETAKRQPEHSAILGPGLTDRISYAELNQRICSISELLRHSGVRSGDSVGLHCRSGAQYILLNYAIWRCGGCVVPIPTELAAAEKRELFREIALDFVISEKSSLAPIESLCRGEAVELGGNAVVAPATAFREHPVGFHELNPAFIRFTSGTTAASKGVVLSHETIWERINAANEVLSIGRHDRVVWLLSMSYHFAVSIVTYMSFGAGIILAPHRLGSLVVQAAKDFRGTVIYGSPLHYAWMADYEQAGPLPNLRLAISTTSPLDRSTAERFYQRFRLPLCQALGIIEVGLPCINLDFAIDRSESVGRVLPAYQLRLEDAGLGADHREMWLNGKGFLDAYYQPWQPRTDIMRDGWFRTGDIAELDQNGCLFLRGRIKELINVLGVKFFPQEVEDVLMSHPQVAAACVFAEADPRFGEIPVARVVTHPQSCPLPEADLLELCRSQLASFKVPQRIEFVSALSRTASGKVLHREVSPLVEQKRRKHEIGT